MKKAKQSKLICALLEDDKTVTQVEIPYGCDDSLQTIDSMLHDKIVDLSEEKLFFQVFLVANYLEMSTIIDVLVKSLAVRMCRARQIPDQVFADLSAYFDLASYYVPDMMTLCAYYLRLGYSDIDIHHRMHDEDCDVEGDYFQPSKLWHFSRAVRNRNMQMFYNLLDDVVCFSSKYLECIVEAGTPEMLRHALQYPGFYLSVSRIFDCVIESKYPEMFQVLIENKQLCDDFCEANDLSLFFKKIMSCGNSSMLRMFFQAFSSDDLEDMNPFDFAWFSRAPIDIFHVLLFESDLSVSDYQPIRLVFEGWSSRGKRFDEDFIRLCAKHPDTNIHFLECCRDPNIQKIYQELK